MTLPRPGAALWLAGLATLLVVACAWLASGVGSEPSWLTPGASGSPAAVAAQPPAPPPPALQLQALTPIWRTPLFSPSRSPDAPPRGPEPGLELAGLKLTGIVIADGVRQALFKRADGKDLPLREGAELGGWRLRRIEAQAVHFEQDGRSQRLQLPAPRLPDMPPPRPASTGAQTH